VNIYLENNVEDFDTALDFERALEKIPQPARDIIGMARDGWSPRDIGLAMRLDLHDVHTGLADGFALLRARLPEYGRSASLAELLTLLLLEA